MKILFVWLIACIPHTIKAQKHGEALIDSLAKSIVQLKTDSDIVKQYLRISDTYIDYDLNKALLFADSAAHLAKKIQWRQGIAKSQVNYGNVYNFTGNYKQAVEHAQQAYAFYKKNNDQKSTATAAYTLGVANERMGNYTAAAEKYFEALHIFESLPGEDRLTGNSLSAVAVICFLQRDYKKSLDYSFKALAKQQAAKNTLGIANEYIAIADTYNELKDPANAIKYNLQALEIQQKQGNKFAQALIYFQLGKLYHSNYYRSLDYHFKAEKLFTALSDYSNFATFNRGEIGRLYFEIARGKTISADTSTGNNIPKDRSTLLQLSEQYLQKSVWISRETGDKDNESSFSKDLAELQAYKGEYKNAYLNFMVFHKIQDSIYSQQNKNKIAALESQKEIDLKNKTIENKELQLRNQRNKMWLLILGVAFLVILGSVFYSQSVKRKKTNTTLSRLNKELDEANKLKAKFFGILSHDLRSPVANLINYLQLQKRNGGMISQEEITGAEHKITESAESLLETMEGMLLWSKGQMENFTPAFAAVPVNNLFVYLQKFFAHTGHIALHFSDPENLVVYTDEDYLKTIMQNLTANSIKAVEQTTLARIEWKAWKEKGSIYISITDNGKGILHEEKLSALYTAEAPVGSREGLGLHIIRDLAKAIQCSIKLQQDNDACTTFVLSMQQAG